MAYKGTRGGRFARRAVGNDAGAGGLLGGRLRLAQDRGQLNATPQFVTQIDGVDIQFIHVRSKHDNALPLIITHGWPVRSSSK